ncbi:DUF6163 family protein [Agrobacterium sp. ES01]|uniref:DUF6163 family protein n=1 Tax=Agrobacterium sp. ES01 TaxID=3420714 RepID=UPI003D12F06E
MDADSSHAPKPSLTESLFVVFFRLVAVSCLWLGLQYWAMLTGYSLGGMGRFDLLSVPWKVAASTLAVVFPVAALGLWIAAAWGSVIWVFAAGLQFLMYGLWTDTFGQSMLIITMHCTVVLVYAVFRLALWLEARQRH